MSSIQPTGGTPTPQNTPAESTSIPSSASAALNQLAYDLLFNNYDDAQKQLTTLSNMQNLPQNIKTIVKDTQTMLNDYNNNLPGSPIRGDAAFALQTQMQVIEQTLGSGLSVSTQAQQVANLADLYIASPTSTNKAALTDAISTLTNLPSYPGSYPSLPAAITGLQAAETPSQYTVALGKLLQAIGE